MECVFITEAQYLADYRIWLKFNTGETGVVDLKDIVYSQKKAEPLRDPIEFAKFHLDSWPTLSWDCGFDIAPESLYQRAKKIAA